MSVKKLKIEVDENQNEIVRKPENAVKSQRKSFIPVSSKKVRQSIASCARLDLTLESEEQDAKPTNKTYTKSE
jgi:hypothetical protein